MRTLLMSLFLVFLFKEHLAEKTIGSKVNFPFGLIEYPYTWPSDYDTGFKISEIIVFACPNSRCKRFKILHNMTKYTQEITLNGCYQPSYEPPTAGQVRLKFSFGGKLSVHDTIVDPIEKTMVVTVGDVSDHPNVTSTTNLHDFGTGVLALKDIKGGKCYIITPMTEAFPSASDLLAQESTVVAVDNILHYTHDGIALDNTSLQTLGGSRIASFCRSYRSYSLTLKQKTKRELELDEPLSLSQIQSAPANMVTGTVYCYCNGHTINSAM